MAARPALLKCFFSVFGTALIGFSFGVAAARDPAPQSPEAANGVQTGPLSEVNFYRLVRRVHRRETTTEAAIRELRQRGVAFEVTDDVLARARRLGAPGDLLTALVELDLERAAAPRPTARPRRTETIPAGTPPGAGRPTAPPPVEDESPSAAGPGDDAGEAERLRRLPLIEQARFYALRSADDLPDFLVTQTIRRMTRDGGGGWRLRDVLETEVRVEGGRERVELLSVNGRPTNRRFEEMGGATSVGDFSGQLAAPFLPATNTRFTEVKQERYRGRLCRVYDFVVPQANSGYTLTVRLSDGRPQRIQVGYQGSLWVDEETKRIVRIEHTATDIPPGFPMSQVESAVDYDWVTILGKRYWMPRTAETIQISDAYRQAFRNISEFRNYRKFEGDVKILDD